MMFSLWFHALAGYLFFSCNNRNPHTRGILSFTFTSLDMDYIMYYGQNILNYDSISQLEALDRRTIEVQLLTFTCVNNWYFFNRVYNSWRHFCFRCTKSATEAIWRHKIQNYFLKKYTLKHFWDVSNCISKAE